jgi:hypothetical protein
MRNRTPCGVGFVLPDNPVSLLTAIVSCNGDGRSKTNFADRIGIRNDSCGRPTCAPVTKISGGACHFASITSRLCHGQRVASRCHRGFDLLEAALCHVVGVFRDQTVWKVFQAVRILIPYKSSAHFVYTSPNGSRCVVIVLAFKPSALAHSGEPPIASFRLSVSDLSLRNLDTL